MVRVAILCLLFNLNFTLYVYWPLFVQTWGSGSYLAALAGPFIGLGCGYLLVSSLRVKDGGMRHATEITSAVRNIGPMLLMMIFPFVADPLVTVAITILNTIGLVVVLLFALVWRRAASPRALTPHPARQHPTRKLRRMRRRVPHWQPNRLLGSLPSACDVHGGISVLRRGVESMSEQVREAQADILSWIDKDITGPMRDFQNPDQEWRRLFSELYGTFLLVIVAAGGGMMSQAFPNTISRTAAVVAPGLMVMGIIMFMGKVSGAHLNPAVSVAFALRGDFPWRRVPGYIVVQLIGATLAALLLHGIIKVSATFGSNYVAHGYAGWQGYLMEALLTTVLVSVILGTASGAQNIGIFGALGVGAYIALAGLWGSPISGASMNPARTFGPDLIGLNFSDYWVYLLGPLTGAVIAVGIAYVLRGLGGGRSGSAAAQGELFTEQQTPDQA